MLDRYLTVLDVEPTTRRAYEGYIRNHIRPALGQLPLGRLDAERLESFYAELRTCRARCAGRRPVEHRTVREHTCDHRCGPHRCRDPDGRTWLLPDRSPSGTNGCADSWAGT